MTDAISTDDCAIREGEARPVAARTGAVGTDVALPLPFESIMVLSPSRGE